VGPSPGIMVLRLEAVPLLWSNSITACCCWPCGVVGGANVVQAQRQIHRAHLGRPHCRRSLLTQGLVWAESG
jgi:hypothetical protein